MQVRATWKGAPKVTVIALESDHIADTGPYVGSEFARSLWIQNEKMADDRFEMAHEEEEPIGILIGMDQMFQIMSNEAAIQSPCGLRAFKTKLGRMIAGPSQETKSKMGNKVIQQLILTSNYPVPQITSAFTANSQSNRKINSNQPNEIPTEKETGTASLQHPQIGASFSDAPTGSSGKTDSKRFKNDELNATNFDLSLFWKLENFANLDGAEAVESEDRFDSFDEKITRLPDGRYSTPIPWSTDKWRLQKNLPLATGRVESTLNKLRKNPGDLVNYHKEIQLLIDSKFVEKANMDYEELHTYLPHHPVYQVDKTTTKVRPVFDGAAKTKFGPSLNDVLEAGPNLNPDLLSVLMRFRKHKIAWIADTEKAFLNIALHPEDAEAIRFLWPKEPEIPGFPPHSVQMEKGTFRSQSQSLSVTCHN